MSRLIMAAPPQGLGTAGAPLRFANVDPGPRRRLGRRCLTLDGEEAFELSFWCGTCPFLFERKWGANRRLSPAGLTARLNEGLPGPDPDVVAAAAGLLPQGVYVPLLAELTPRLVSPGQPGDYFAEEQVRTWGIDSFWGLPHHPRTPYYRAGDQSAGDSAQLFEFVVPMVPPGWNEEDRVREYLDRIGAGAQPVALAVSILDICQPAVAGPGATEPDQAHWGFVHFLLDGHHKLQAAAEAGAAIRILSLLSVDHSLAGRDAVLALPAMLTSA
jgi:hypothetical protein